MEKKSNLKKSNLKKFLATASAFAVIAGGVHQAKAVDTLALNGGGASTLANAGHWRTAAGDNTAPVAGAANNIFLIADHGIDFDAAIGNLGTLYSYGHDGTVTVTHLNPLQGVSNDVSQATIGAVKLANNSAAVAAGNGGKLAFNVNGALAQEFLGDGVAAPDGTITTNTLSGLGNVTLSDDAAILKLSGNNVSLGGTIDGAGNGQGVVEVNATNVQFAGVIGGTKGIQQLKLNTNKSAILKANAKFDDTKGAGGIEIGNNSTLTVDGGVNITTNDTNKAGLSIDAANANNGTLILQGASDVAIGIGAGKALNIVQINNGTVDFKGSANNGGENLKANNFVLNHANAVMKLSTVNHVITGNIIATNPNEGKVLISGANSHEITGNIGEANNAIDEITFAAAANGQVLTIKGATLIHTANGVVSDTAGGNGGGKIDIQSDNLSLNSNFGTSANYLNELQITSNAAGSGAATVTLGAGKSIFTNKFISDAGQANIFIMKANSSVRTFGGDALKFNNAGSILRFAEDGAKITGAVKSSGGGVTGKIEVAGNAIITGNAGTGERNDRLDSISFITNDEKTLQVGGDVGTANGVIFAKNGTLEFIGNKAHTLTGNVVIGAAGAAGAGVVGGSGTVRIAANVGANIVEFKGQIGDKGNAKKLLNLLQIDGATTAKFTTSGNVHINTVKLEGDGVVELSKAGHYKIDGFQNISNNGTLKISENVTLMGRADKAAINFGTSDARLKEFAMNSGKTLNIEDGVNIHANKFTNGGNHCKLVFKGTSIFEMGALASAGNGALNTITLDANANVTIASPNTVVNGFTTLGDKSTLSLQGDYTGTIDGNADDNGTLKFTNTHAATLQGAVGGGNALASIEFEGSDVTFEGDVANTNKAFVFAGKDDDAARTITFKGNIDLGNSTFTNNRTVTDTIVLGKSTTFTKNLATDPAKQLNFQLSDTINAKVTDGDATGTNFTASEDGKGSLKLDKAALVINSAGADGKSLAEVTFINSATITHNLYAAKVDVAAAKTATLGGTIQSDNFSLAGAGSKVIFTDNAKIDSAIKATIAGKGQVEFAGGATITQNLGTAANALKTVTFTGDDSKIVELGANVYAANTIMGQSTIELTKDVVTISGTTNADSTIFELDNKTLEFNNITMNGSNTIKFNVSDKGDNLAGGNIVISGNLILADDAALVIDTKADKVSRPTGGTTREFTLIKNNGTFNFDKSSITLVSHEKSLITWTKSFDNKGGIKLIIEDNAAKVLKEALVSKDDTNNANIDALTNAAQGTDGHKFVGLLEEFFNAGQNNDVNEAIERLTSQTTVTAALEDSVSSVGQSLGERAMSLAGNQGTPVETRVVGSENISGVSAGEQQARFGAWFSPFFNKNTQKARKGAAGYKSEAYGASFGFDTRANDDMIIGAAITASNSELKHKDLKSGDKTKINSLLFSIYGTQQITDSWFALGSATFGTNEVKKNSKRKTLNGYEVANGKYSSMSFSGGVMFGYNYVTEQATLTPMAGFRYSRVNDVGHKESGTSLQNLDVTNKASNKFEVVAGLRASGGTFDLNGLTVTPEVHGFINYDLINKASKSSVKLGSTDLTAKSSKPARASYNLGLGANAEYGMMEYGASYDAQLANKRVGHQGTLRLRVNF
jgi:outer membrane autotransporter protein